MIPSQCKFHDTVCNMVLDKKQLGRTSVKNIVIRNKGISLNYNFSVYSDSWTTLTAIV